jgi:uncharacterized FlaG/YvyC family protein
MRQGSAPVGLIRVSLSAAPGRKFCKKGVDMAVEGINSNPRPALDAGRVPNVPEASARTAVSRLESKSTEPLKSPTAEPEPRGVPQTLAVRQQLPPNTRLRVDEESNRIVAQILDENDEVVRQIPPEALLELSSKFNRLEGLLFDRES